MNDPVSTLGYKRYSPYKSQSSLVINTPKGLIDMNEVDTPLIAKDLKNGDTRVLQPNSGFHQFQGDKILEQPVNNSNTTNTKAMLGKPTDNYKWQQAFTQAKLKMGGYAMPNDIIKTAMKDYTKQGGGFTVNTKSLSDDNLPSFLKKAQRGMRTGFTNNGLTYAKGQTSPLVRMFPNKQKERHDQWKQVQEARINDIYNPIGMSVRTTHDPLNTPESIGSNRQAAMAELQSRTDLPTNYLGRRDMRRINQEAERLGVQFKQKGGDIDPNLDRQNFQTNVGSTEITANRATRPITGYKGSKQAVDDYYPLGVQDADLLDKYASTPQNSAVNSARDKANEDALTGYNQQRFPEQYAKSKAAGTYSYEDIGYDAAKDLGFSEYKDGRGFGGSSYKDRIEASGQGDVTTKTGATTNQGGNMSGVYKQDTDKENLKGLDQDQWSRYRSNGLIDNQGKIAGSLRANMIANGVPTDVIDSMNDTTIKSIFDGTYNGPNYEGLVSAMRTENDALATKYNKDRGIKVGGDGAISSMIYNRDGSVDEQFLRQMEDQRAALQFRKAADRYKALGYTGKQIDDAILGAADEFPNAAAYIKNTKGTVGQSQSKAITSSATTVTERPTEDVKTNTTTTFTPGYKEGFDSRSGVPPKSNTVPSRSSGITGMYSRGKVPVKTSSPGSGNKSSGSYRREPEVKTEIKTQPSKGLGNTVEQKKTAFIPKQQLGGYTPGYFGAGHSFDGYMQAVSNRPNTTFQQGQRIKYQKGGRIQEGVVKDYDANTGNITLY